MKSNIWFTVHVGSVTARCSLWAYGQGEGPSAPPRGWDWDGRAAGFELVEPQLPRVRGSREVRPGGVCCLALLWAGQPLDGLARGHGESPAHLCLSYCSWKASPSALLVILMEISVLNLFSFCLWRWSPLTHTGRAKPRTPPVAPWGKRQQPDSPRRRTSFQFFHLHSLPPPPARVLPSSFSSFPIQIISDTSEKMSSGAGPPLMIVARVGPEGGRVEWQSPRGLGRERGRRPSRGSPWPRQCGWHACPCTGPFSSSLV